MNESTSFPVLLMECFLAGFHDHEAEKYWDDLPIGEELRLVREPGNPHDSRAVRVDWLGATLGYLPREANFTISQMLDRDEQVEVRIAYKRSGDDPRTRILLQVFVQADSARNLPTLHDMQSDDKTPPLRNLAANKPLTADDDARAYNEMNPLIHGLAWMLASKVIGKAQASGSHAG